MEKPEISSLVNEVRYNLSHQSVCCLRVSIILHLRAKGRQVQEPLFLGCLMAGQEWHPPLSSGQLPAGPALASPPRESSWDFYAKWALVGDAQAWLPHPIYLLNQNPQGSTFILWSWWTYPILGISFPCTFLPFRHVMATLFNRAKEIVRLWLNLNIFYSFVICSWLELS